MSMRLKPIYCCLLTLGLLFLFASCGEKVPLDGHHPAYDISYSGNLILGEPIRFQSSAPAGSSLLWKFGDGTVSTQFSPTYSYYSIAHVGNTIVDDTVVLIVDNDIYHPNIKYFQLKPCVNKVAGNFFWQGGTFAIHGNCCPGLSDHSLPDTTFKVFPVDDYTVSTWSGKLNYLVDSNYYSNERSSSRYNATWLKYTKDTLYFMQRSGTDTGWAEIRYFHKY
jgi:hypothetical protein